MTISCLPIKTLSNAFKKLRQNYSQISTDCLKKRQIKNLKTFINSYMTNISSFLPKPIFAKRTIAAFHYIYTANTLQLISYDTI